MHNEHDPDEGAGPALPEEILSGLEGGAEAAARRERWLAEHPERAEELEEVAEIWRLTQPSRDAHGWPELRARIERHRSPKLRPAAHFPRAGWRSPLRAAAVLIVGIGLGLLAPRLGLTPRAAAGRTVVSVPAAAMTTLRLPGGVVAHVNAASTLSYATSRSEVREVELNGEAYFEVPHSAARHFTVRTASGVVRDLGTDFNVRARGDRVVVVVTKGTVRLEAAEHAVTVRAGEKSSAGADQPPAQPVPADVEEASGWMRGDLVFIDRPLSSVAAELQRHYGVPFRVAESLRERRITATIQARASADAAHAICAVVSARCEAVGDGWSISAAP
ncbi:MAG TPA: FecR domain-containing protein [Longimicrobiaceae bacterium]|nr:FecR domain-containing protein [Longimicrobiaceae bacterium]